MCHTSQQTHRKVTRLPFELTCDFLKQPSEPTNLNCYSQFKKLDLLPTNLDQIRSASHPMNLRKNRMISVRPYDSNRVVLPFKLDANKCIIEQTDYINASRIGKPSFVSTKLTINCHQTATTSNVPSSPLKHRSATRSKTFGA